jgi:hypothetical protein
MLAADRRHGSRNRTETPALREKDPHAYSCRM